MSSVYSPVARGSLSESAASRVSRESASTRAVSAVSEALRADPRFQLLAAPRGKDPERALELELRFKAR